LNAFGWSSKRLNGSYLGLLARQYRNVEASGCSERKAKVSLANVVYPAKILYEILETETPVLWHHLSCSTQTMSRLASITIHH